MIKKKIITIIIFLFVLPHCGFTPIYLEKTNLNFSIEKIYLKGDSTLNNLLKTNLIKYKNENRNKKISIDGLTIYKKSILSKDRSENVTNYEISANIEFIIKSGFWTFVFIFPE